MKSRTVRLACILALAIPLSGCLEIDTTTRVHPDGHLTRTVVVTGDSTDFTANTLATFGLDSGWTVVVDSGGTRNRKMTLQRDFEDAESASKALAGVPMERRGISIRLEKKFRWFTTLFRYEEAWEQAYLFTKIPMSEYFSPEEISMLRAGELKENDSLMTGGQKRHAADLEKRGEEWFNRNSFEEVLAAFLDGVRRIDDPRLTTGEVEAAKETLYAAMKGHFKTPLTESGPIVEVIKSVLKSPAVPRALDAARPEIERYDRAVDYMERVQVPGQTLGVVMPGIITNTNGSSVEGNTVTWKDFKDNAFYEGFTMWAESRMVNWWAVVVAAVVLLGIGSLLVVGLVRRRPAAP